MTMIVYPTTVAGLDGDDLDLYRTLLRRIQRKRARNMLRRTYYDGRNRLKDIGYSLPRIARDVNVVVGWPEKAVEALANRVVLDGMTPADGADMSELASRVMDENGIVQLAQSVHTDTLVASCAFVAVVAGDPGRGEPDAVVEEFTADTATGIWDKRTRSLSAALLFETDDVNEHVTGAYLMDRAHSLTLTPVGGQWQVADRVESDGGPLPVELFAFKPSTMRPFGRSRIDRTVMSLTDSAVRTFMRSELQAELYSVPPRYFLGVDESMFTDADGNTVPKWQVMMDQVLALPNNPETGETPQVGSFTQYSFEPHIAQLRQTASMFASHTSLPPDAMGVLQDNPSSAEAIDKAQKELCLLAENCQRWWSAPWERILQRAQETDAAVRARAAYDAALDAGRVPDTALTTPESPQDLQCMWRNPSTPSRAAAADAAVKLVQAQILPADSQVTYDMIDLTDRQRNQLRTEADIKQTDENLAYARQLRLGVSGNNS